MNKSDIKLLILLLSIALISFLLIKFNQKKDDNLKAIVYYEDREILTINMNINNIYTVNGYLGPVVIVVENKKIAVKEEISPNNLCSKQGFVSNSMTPIICLPNKIIIKLVSNLENEVDVTI